MRILLISVANNAGSMAALPLGLACVAAATERAGHQVTMLAMDSDADCEIDVRQAIQRFLPDVIGVSVRNIDDQNMQMPHFLLASLRHVIAACRAASSSPIVIGGAGYSIFPESALAYLDADIGIRGEGEAAFPALLKWFDEGRESPPPPATSLPNGSHFPQAFAPVLDDFLLPEPRL